MNLSARTLGDLERFAKTAPKRAEAYLSEVEAELRRLGETKHANAIARLLDAKGPLATRIAAQGPRLTDIFPVAATDWAAVQHARADTLGFVSGPALKAPLSLRGQVALDAHGQLVLQTEGGRALRLHTDSAGIEGGLAAGRLSGFIGDGEVTVVGTPGEDRETFNVEGFALRTRDGRYDTFTFGRVAADGTGNVSTARGLVEIKDDALRNKLRVVPRFGVILPGAPVKRGQRLVYEGDPKDMYGLARFTGTETTTAAGKRRQRVGDMAFSSFNGKPIEFPAKTDEARITHAQRLWVRGDFRLDAYGAPSAFVAAYVSGPADAVETPAATQTADGVQAAVHVEVI